MVRKHNSILKFMDTKNFVLYSCVDGRFYLVNIDSLSTLLSDKILRIKGKQYFDNMELHEIIANAQNPESVDISQFKFPLAVGVMVANKCNLTCNYCIAKYGNGYSMHNNLPLVSKCIASELKESSVISVMISGGEPTLYDKLCDFLVDLSHEDLICLLDTNGTQINDELMRVLKSTDVIPRVSLDSIHIDEHNTNRGMFEQTYRNIEKMLNLGIKLRINTVLSKTNANSLLDFADWLCKHGVDKWHIFKLQRTFAPSSIWLNDSEAVNALSRIDKEYGDKIDILYKFSSKNDGFSSFVIDSEGDCFSTKTLEDGINKKCVFGNITRESLCDIWTKTPLDYRRRHYNKYLYYLNKEI